MSNAPEKQYIERKPKARRMLNFTSSPACEEILRVIPTRSISALSCWAIRYSKDQCLGIFDAHTTSSDGGLRRALDDSINIWSRVRRSDGVAKDSNPPRRCRSGAQDRIKARLRRDRPDGTGGGESLYRSPALLCAPRRACSDFSSTSPRRRRMTRRASVSRSDSTTISRRKLWRKPSDR